MASNGRAGSLPVHPSWQSKFTVAEHEPKQHSSQWVMQSASTGTAAQASAHSTSQVASQDARHCAGSSASAHASMQFVAHSSAHSESHFTSSTSHRCSHSASQSFVHEMSASRLHPAWQLAASSAAHAKSMSRGSHVVAQPSSTRCSQDASASMRTPEHASDVVAASAEGAARRRQGRRARKGKRTVVSTTAHARAGTSHPRVVHPITRVCPSKTGLPLTRTASPRRGSPRCP